MHGLLTLALGKAFGVTPRPRFAPKSMSGNHALILLQTRRTFSPLQVTHFNNVATGAIGSIRYMPTSQRNITRYCALLLPGTLATVFIERSPGVIPAVVRLCKFLPSSQRRLPAGTFKNQVTFHLSRSKTLSKTLPASQFHPGNTNVISSC